MPLEEPRGFHAAVNEIVRSSMGWGPARTLPEVRSEYPWLTDAEWRRAYRRGTQWVNVLNAATPQRQRQLIGGIIQSEELQGRDPLARIDVTVALFRRDPTTGRQVVYDYKTVRTYLRRGDDLSAIRRQALQGAMPYLTRYGATSVRIDNLFRGVF